MNKYARVLTVACMILGIAVFAACSSSKGNAGASRSAYTGNWTLNNISFDGISSSTKFKATVFDDVAYSCLQGSSWSLPNNGQGSYTVNSSGPECASGLRQIYWSLQKDGSQQYFQFKRLDGDVKAKNVTAGYRMEVTSIGDNNMQLRSPVNFEGRTIYIIYDFSR